MSWLFNSAIDWLTHLILDALNGLWVLLLHTALLIPNVTTLPQVQDITSTSLAVVNVCFVLAILAAGAVLMGKETVQTRYGLQELGPRLVVGFIAANVSTLLCDKLITLANAVTQALAGDNIAGGGAFSQLRDTVTGSLTSGPAAIMALIFAGILMVMTALMLVQWLARLGLLVVLVGIAPCALACHATPWTEPRGETVVARDARHHRHRRAAGVRVARRVVGVPQPRRQRAIAGDPERPDPRIQPVHRHRRVVDGAENPRPDAPLRHPRQRRRQHRPVRHRPATDPGPDPGGHPRSRSEHQPARPAGPPAGAPGARRVAAPAGPDRHRSAVAEAECRRHARAVVAPARTPSAVVPPARAADRVAPSGPPRAGAPSPAPRRPGTVQQPPAAATPPANRSNPRRNREN